MPRAIISLLLLATFVPAYTTDAQAEAERGDFGLGNLQAQVILDPETGTGSVDAAVVAAQLTLAPDRLEDEAGAIGFVLAKEQDLTFSCGGLRTVHITERTDYVLDSSEQRDLKGHLKAFALDGHGHAVGSLSAPTLGATCVVGEPSPSPQVWRSLTEEDPQYRLYVAYRGFEILLWPGSGLGIQREPVDEWWEDSGHPRD